jgi:hypothetical protein
VLNVLNNWPSTLQFLARLVNEVHGMRADLRVAFQQKPLIFDPILTPTQRVEQAEDRQEVRDLHDDLMARLRGEKRD